MKITTEVSTVNDFEFWAGAVETVRQITSEEFEQIIAILEDAYPEGMTATGLNDFFWFEDETISEWLGRDIWNDDEDADGDEADEEEE